MAAVVIGLDPHKRSNTVVVIDGAEGDLATARFANDREGYRLMRAFVRRFNDRTWAVEGAGGAGKHIAQRLVSDGEFVVDGRPSRLPVCGCIPRAMVARTTRPTPGRSPSRRCAHRT